MNIFEVIFFTSKKICELFIYIRTKLKEEMNHSNEETRNKDSI